jgi:hypothetical protein
MKFKTAHSVKTDINAAIEEIKNSIEDNNTRFVIFFSSSNYNAIEVSKGMKDAFKKLPVVGCTTSGEISSNCMSDNGLVAMAIGDEVVDDIAIELIPDLSDPLNGVEKAFSNFEKHYGLKMKEMSAEKYVGMILTDGLSGAEEALNERIGDLTNVMFVGGSAGDDLAFDKTYVFADGKVYTNASLLILIKSKLPFDIIKTQSFEPTENKLFVTKADESKRCVMEINEKPATQAYAESLGVPEKDVADYFFKNPVGLVFDKDNLFVRSPQRKDGQNIIFYCNIKEGMELHLLKSTDIISDSKKAIEEKTAEMGSISGIINFNCILRTLDLKQQNRTEEYAVLFKNIPTIGFSTYGESFIGHINQTATMLAFK